MAQVAVAETMTPDNQPQTIRYPKIEFPFPLKVNPMFSSVNFVDRAFQWLLDLNLGESFTPSLREMIRKMDSSVLVGHVYAFAGEWGLEWACKFFQIIWIWDDTLETGRPEDALVHILDLHLIILWSFPDDSVLRSRLDSDLLNFLDVEERQQKIMHIDSVLAEARSKPGTVYRGAVSWLCTGFLNLWEEAMTKTTDGCLRLARSTQVWMAGIYAETRHNYGPAKHLPLPMNEYIRVRRNVGAIPVTIAMLNIIHESIVCSDDWLYSPEMVRMLDASNDVVCWHNDLWSFNREVLIEKSVFNLVFIVSVEQKVSYSKAVDIVSKMMDDRIVDMERAAADLKAITPPQYTEAMNLYIDTCRNWLPATEHFHSISIRYK